MNESLEELTALEMDMGFKARVHWIFDKLDPRPKDLVIDIGCGRGFYAEYIRRLTDSRYVGIEYDWAILKEAKTKVPLKNGLFLRGAAESLAISNGTVDKAILSEVLEHVSDDKAALKEIFRILKPGAKLALTVPNAKYPFCWDPINWIKAWLKLQPIRQGIFAGVWANHERLYTEKEISALVSETGFKIREVTLLTRFCFPFMQFLVYGIGKEILVRGFAPHYLAMSVDRYSRSPTNRRKLGVISLLRNVFEAVDALNIKRPPRSASISIAMLVEK